MAAPRKSYAAFHPAARKGYSGVGLYAKHPHRAAHGFGHAEFDAEGRYLQSDFADVSVISLYMPSGSATRSSTPKAATCRPTSRTSR